MMGATISSLPEGYTNINYLESDGTQFIDTGFVPNQDTRVKMSILASGLSGETYAYGARNSAGSNAFLCALEPTEITFGYAIQYRAYEGVIDGRYDIDQNKNIMTVNGTEISGNYVESFSSESNLTLFGRNTAGSVEKLSAIKLYSCQIYDNDVLVRDFIPCTNPDGISGLWDSVNNVFYKMLPAGYTKLDFIESDGTEYIDTGFKPNSNTRVIFEGYNNSTSSIWIFGAWKAKNDKMFAAAALNTYNVCYGAEIWANATMPVGPISIDMNKNAYTYNGVSGTLSEQTFSCDYTMYLFHINAAGAVSSGSFNGRIYSVKIYDNGTLVRDFIPAMNASGEAGLYDLKNDVWYALKPVVTKKENKISIVETGDFLEREYYIYCAYENTSELSISYSATHRMTSPAGRPIFITQENTIILSRHERFDFIGYVGEISDPTITSISPTEDDTYIYTF